MEYIPKNIQIFLVSPLTRKSVLPRKKKRQEPQMEIPAFAANDLTA